MISWLGFLLALFTILIFSKRNLGIAMFAGAIILGIFLNPKELPTEIWGGLTDPSTVLLAAVVSVIPIIGSVLNETGQLDRLVKSMRVGRRLFLMLAPALIGLLPMPGGALLSAPLVDKAGLKMPSERKAGVNVWFRHILYLVYPLSADLIVSTASAEIDLYQPIPYLLAILVFALLIGFFFFLRDNVEELKYDGNFSLKSLFPPLLILLIAPFLDLMLCTLLVLPAREMATLLAVLTSLILATIIGKIGLMGLYRVVLKVKPWNFALMMTGIMVFLRVFKGSGALNLFLEIPLTPEALFGIAFLLGFATGRIVTPAGIVFPIYTMKFGSIPLPIFSLLYFGIFLGYVMTPVHPCVSLTLSSIKSDLKGYFRVISLPVGVASFISLVVIHVLSS